jgi:hypothetical protein
MFKVTLVVLIKLGKAGNSSKYQYVTLNTDLISFVFSAV